MAEGQEEHIGDGLYVSFDGFMYRLRAPRTDGDHFVYLEPFILLQFLEYVKRFTPTLLGVSDEPKI